MQHTSISPSRIVTVLGLFILFSSKLYSQAFNFSVTNQYLCYYGPSTYTTGATVSSSAACATSYTWVVAGPALTPSAQIASVPGGSASAISFSACGVYTITCYAYNNGIPCTNVAQTVEVVCPNACSVTATPSTPALCASKIATLSSACATTYTWYAQPVGSTVSNIGTGPSLTVAPNVNTSYTVVGITAQGCSVSATKSYSIQQATMTVSPLNSTLCPGAPLTLNGAGTAVNGTNVAAGTATTGFSWYNPSNTNIGNLNTVLTAAAAGQYTAVLTHTGAAGTCSLLATVNVSTINTVSLTLKGNNVLTPSVCPGGSVTLTGTITASSQTASPGYTWSAPASPNFTGNPVVRTPTVATVYTCIVTYYGCTGTNTISVAMSTITPTLSASSASTCPNRSLTLTAIGGINYTFSAIPAVGPATANITKPSPTVNTVVHIPTAAQLPIQYCVNASSVGCLGSACTTVGLLTLNTTLSAVSPSICPNTNVTLYSNNGAGTTYTYASINYAATIGTASSSGPNTGTISHNPGISFPHTYTVTSDSAGCLGSSILQIDQKILTPSLSVSQSSICPGTSVIITGYGGAGTTYTFFAPYATPNPSNIIPKSTPSTAATPSVSTTTPTLNLFPHTYTVSVDSAGCTGTNTINVNLFVIQPILSISAASVCPNSILTLTSTGGSGTNYTFTASYPTTGPGTFVIPKGALSVNNASTTLPSSPLSFPHTYTVEVDSAGCQGVSTKTVGLLNLSNNLTLTAVSGAIQNSVCPGSTFTLQAQSTTGSAAISYSFIAPPGLPLTNQTFSSATHSTNVLPSTYTVVSDSAGCGGVKTITVNPMSLRNLSVTATPTLVCASMPVTLTANTGYTNTAGYNYTFFVTTPTAGIYNGPNPTVVVNPTINTTYVLYADSAGCATNTNNIASVNVGIRPALSLSTTVSQYSVCAGLPTTLSVSGPSNNITYTWSPAGVSTSGTLTLGPSPYTIAVSNPTSNVSYTINASDPLGCLGSTIISIGVDPTASLNVTAGTSAGTLCPGLTATMTSTCNISTASYTWFPNTGLNTNLSSSVITSPSITTVYSVIAGNGWGCFGSAQNTIIVNSYPSLTITPTSSAVCPGFQSTLTAFGASSYTWTSPTFSGSIIQTSLSVGPGVYKLKGTNGGGCVDSTLFTVGIAAPLNIQISQSTPTTCITDNFPNKLSKPVVLTANGANTYVWFPYDPTIMTYSLGPVTQVRPHATTVFTVTGNTAICSGSAIIGVTVVPQFSMNAIPPLPAMCFGDSIKLSMTNVSNLAVGPSSAFKYRWSAPIPNIMEPGGSTAALSSTIMAYPQSNTTFTAEVFDSRGCVSLPRLSTVSVFPRPITAIAVPTINSVATNTICFVGLSPGEQGNLLTLTASNKNSNLPFGVIPTYTWVSPYNVTSILTDVNNPAVTISAPKKLPSLVTYSVYSGYNGIPGCRRVDTVTVRVIDCRPVTLVTFTTGEPIDTICTRECITFVNTTDTAAGGPQNFIWTFPGGSPASSTASLQTVCYNLPGMYNVFLTVSNSYPTAPPNGAAPGSTRSIGAQSFVKVVDIPNVTIFSPGQLRSDTTIRFGQRIELKGSGAFTYSWSPNYNITSINNSAVQIFPTKNTQYILTGKNSKKCYSSDTLNVLVIQDCGEMFVPSAFTPNNDQHNDVLKVYGNCLQTMIFMVFNRWGEKVFETSDKEIGWDGTFKGEALNTGVYVYRLEGKTFEGKSFSAKGNITLIR